MNTLPGSAHHLDFFCACGALLCLAVDVYRINLNCVWARCISNTVTGERSWNVYKKEHCDKLHCAECNFVIGAWYPQKHLAKLFYANMRGHIQLLCRAAPPHVCARGAVAQHTPLDPSVRTPTPLTGAPPRRDLERERARDLGLAEDERVMRALSLQLKVRLIAIWSVFSQMPQDATLRDAIGATQQAKKAIEEAKQLQGEVRKLEQQV